MRKVQLAKRREHAHVGGELADRFFLQVQSFHLFWSGAKRHKVQQRFKAKGGHFSLQLEREGEKDVRVLLCELHEQFYDLSFLYNRINGTPFFLKRFLLQFFNNLGAGINVVKKNSVVFSFSSKTVALLLCFVCSLKNLQKFCNNFFFISMLLKNAKSRCQRQTALLFFFAQARAHTLSHQRATVLHWNTNEFRRCKLLIHSGPHDDEQGNKVCVHAL